MPQTLLPIIPHGATEINEIISVVRENRQWTYFYGLMPVFQHLENDRRSFRMFTAQLCCQGTCTQAQIVRVFGVSKNSVLRSVKKCREEGIDGFYRPRKGGGPTVMTAEVTIRAQNLLDSGHSRMEVAEELGVKYDTLRKAINQGRLKEPTPAESTEEVSQKSTSAKPPTVPSDKSSRSEADANTGDEMGIACTRPCEHVNAAIGLLPGGATCQFQPCRDVSYGGVIAAFLTLAEN